MILPSHLLPSTPRRSQLLGAPPNQVADQNEFDLDEAPYVLGNPGQPSPTPTTVITLFDDSGSVTGRGGNDPLVRRYDEVENAFQVVARRGSRRELEWCCTSTRRVEPTPGQPITRLGMVALRSGLRRPKDRHRLEHVGAEPGSGRGTSSSPPTASDHAGRLVGLLAARR